MEPFPQPSGPYGVGTVTYHWIDGDRPEIFTEEPNDSRELMVQVWYPSARDAAGPPARYLDEPRALAALARMMHLPASAFDHLADMTTGAIKGARAADDGAPFPVLVFSHGRGGFRQHNTVQAQELVSHGYVVAAIDHPYAATGVVFPDGRLVPIDPRLLPGGVTGTPLSERPFMERVLPFLAQDVRFTLDQLKAANRADSAGVLTDRLDMGRVGTFGPSLGGIIAAEASLLDPRVRACLIMDAYLPADVVAAGLRTPTMWMSRDAATMQAEGWDGADIDATQSSMREVFERLPCDGYLVLVPGMFHVDFSDGRLLSPLFTPGGIVGLIDGDRARTILAEYSLAFFDRHLRGEPAPVLDGPSARFPDVHFESHGVRVA